MLTIRLSRIGKKKKPMYRLIISEKARDPYGRALEILGSYNPYTKDLQVKEDRIKYWISQGSGVSATVNNLLIEKKIIEGEKVVASKPGKKKAGDAKATEEKKEASTEEVKEKESAEGGEGEEKPTEEPKA
ncbi:30S ribosomal protein S16 [Candidatus Parcubacteria bacterium]|nr:MAG: 30S ribosomal protein S16 [Candidatus Parcubacteria bacterium]